MTQELINGVKKMKYCGCCDEMKNGLCNSCELCQECCECVQCNNCHENYDDEYQCLFCFLCPKCCPCSEEIKIKNEDIRLGMFLQRIPDEILHDFANFLAKRNG